MVLLGPPLMVSLTLLGYSSVVGDPTIRTLIMTTNMNIGMAFWMRYRGHSWERTIEMGVGMTAPFVALLVPLRMGLISELFLNVAGHLLMLVGMYGAMVFRREEYSGHAHHAQSAHTDA